MKRSKFTDSQIMDTLKHGLMLAWLFQRSVVNWVSAPLLSINGEPNTAVWTPP